MTEIMLPVGCIAVDFGGTLAHRHDGDIDGAAVAAALADCTGWTAPGGFAEALDRSMQDARSRDRVSLYQTPFVEVMHDAADRVGCTLPADDLWSERVFEHLPDARIGAAEAQAVRELADRGVRQVLASNTRWPLTARSRTLHEAGIGDAFHALVLSTDIGVRKPHDDFYRTVLERAQCPAREVLFVGDTADKDVDPPRRFGMQALLVAPVWDQETHEHKPELPRFADVPALLAAAR